jgi:hypothetical protein
MISLVRIWRPIAEMSTVRDWREVRNNSLEMYPWLVAENSEGRIVGYAYAGTHRERPAYRWTTIDTTIYIDNQNNPSVNSPASASGIEPGPAGWEMAGQRAPTHHGETTQGAEDESPRSIVSDTRGSVRRRFHNATLVAS